MVHHSSELKPVIWVTKEDGPDRSDGWAVCAACTRLAFLLAAMMAKCSVLNATVRAIALVVVGVCERSTHCTPEWRTTLLAV